MLPRLLRHLFANYRVYSFFSSKPGGGRYFNSDKAPKPLIRPGAAPNSAKVESSSSASASDSADGAQEGDGPGNGANSKDEFPPSKTTTDASPDPTPDVSLTPPAPLPHPPPREAHFRAPAHPAPSAQDYKLHQFFSLHRPLLLLAHPSSALFEPPRQGAPFAHAHAPPPPPAHIDTIDDPPEATPEADAHVARQLSRALVINRVGGVIAWEDTLRRLGMDMDKEEGREGLKARMAMKLKDAMLDSTKRKRRKKMKKHKLRKRRRATRAQRLKIGR